MDQDTARSAAAVRAALDALPALSHGAALLDGAELTASVRDLLHLMTGAEAVVIALTTEALSRGLIQESTAADGTQWLGRLARGESSESVADKDELSEASAAQRLGSPGIAPSHARRLARLAEAGRLPRHRLLTEAVTHAVVTTGVAATALQNVDKIAAVLPAATHDDIHGWFLELAPGTGAAGVRALTAEVVHRYGDESHLDDLETTLSAHERVTFATLPCGMVQLTADLSPDHALAVRRAIDALSAPSPATDCCEAPHHRHRLGSRVLDSDTRPAAKRRADALVELIAVAAGAVDEDGTRTTSGSARLTVTIDVEHLTGTLRGLGRVAETDLLAPTTVRRLACDAEILPMVLGSRSEPLDVGRRKRLVSGGLRRAVECRDRHCTFPGCDRPPPWCQVHHVIPWQAGGSTSLDNSALLCQRNHTIVHTHGYTAHVDADGVHWDARRGAIARPVMGAA